MKSPRKVRADSTLSPCAQDQTGPERTAGSGTEECRGLISYNYSLSLPAVSVSFGAQACLVTAQLQLILYALLLP